MSINIFSENVPSFDNEIKYTTKVQNDIEYVNTTGDTLTGDLNLNENKIILKDSKAEIQHAQGDDLMEQCLEIHMDLHLQILIIIIHYFQLLQIFLQITNVL